MMLITPARKQLTWATRDIGNIVLSKQSFAENYWHGDTVKVANARDKRGEGLEEAQVGEGGGGEEENLLRVVGGAKDRMISLWWPLLRGPYKDTEGRNAVDSTQDRETTNPSRDVTISREKYPIPLDAR